jgi:hypothetical protein
MTAEEKEKIIILSKAIKGRNLVKINYEGENRMVEPYLIGELYDKFSNDMKEGVYALRAWFVSGYSSQNLLNPPIFWTGCKYTNSDLILHCYSSNGSELCWRATHQG